ncbi:MAG: MBL fold metallo-hydrolase [Tissierellia bacterium]|nr:MBL fold metallo-hydrolase [Tissierellia bacterium]
MKICSLTSGSTGNCIFVESDKSKILVDCGNSGKLTVELLNFIGVKAEEIDAIFVTHEHIDHIKGVGIMSRKFDIPIIANEKTWLAMKPLIGKIDPKNIIVFKTNTYFTFRDLDVHAVNTFHDAIDPVFFIFYQKQQKISILTDTGIVSDSIIDSIKSSDVYFLESNHDIDMLKNGPYPLHLKHRILSDYGHLSNGVATQIISKLLTGKRESVILGHLSEENNTEIKAFTEMHSNFNKLGISTGKDVILRVAPKKKPDIITDLGGNYR